ncbi:MAG TPA: UbiA family prenyltransferase [Candidatus Methanoperedenaceae archaeon]|nr:UbiA family prenyltransferase [Candidatus Methanoperedenaceae archaeon]
MIGLAVLASAAIGAGSGIGEHSLPVLLGFLIAVIFGMGGNAINDYFDVESDRINHPERPIPSGRLERKHALYFSLILFAISFVLSLILSFVAGYAVFIVVAAALLLQVAYELRFKREKLIGNFLIGFQTALAFIFGGILVGNTVLTGLIALAAFLSIAGREIVKDIEDMEGDRDKVTLPKRIGKAKAGVAASLLILLAVLISPLAYYPLHIFGWEYIVVIAASDAIFLGSIPLIFTNAKLARKILKFAMLVAILAFIIGAMSA